MPPPTHGSIEAPRRPTRRQLAVSAAVARLAGAVAAALALSLLAGLTFVALDPWLAPIPGAAPALAILWHAISALLVASLILLPLVLFLLPIVLTVLRLLVALPLDLPEAPADALSPAERAVGSLGLDNLRRWGPPYLGVLVLAVGSRLLAPDPSPALPDTAAASLAFILGVGLILPFFLGLAAAALRAAAAARFWLAATGPDVLPPLLDAGSAGGATKAEPEPPRSA